MKHLSLFFLFCYIIIPCYAQAEMENAKVEYEKVLSSYPKQLVSFFPKSKDKTVLHFRWEYLGKSALNSIYATFLYTDEQVLDIKEKTEVPLAFYHFTDSCLMMTNYDNTMYDSALYHFTQCNDLYPIPNFDFFLEFSLPNEFYKNAEIYVLDAKKGIYLEEELLWENGVGLPESWKHGYTKGILVSGNIVTYWVEIW